MSQNRSVTLLWTSGWDSTFRLLQLVDAGVVPELIYIIDKRRASHPLEIERMNQILDLIRKRFDVKPEPITFFEKEWVLEQCADDAISRNFKEMQEKYHVGEQYEWFALLARHLDQKLESAVVHQYHGKVEDAVSGEGMFSPVDSPLKNYEFLSKAGEPVQDSIFQNILFPVIDLTKKDEERIAREKGWMEIMNLTWFCFNPRNGEPCGVCGPCDDAMHTGMKWRLPPAARKRNRLMSYYRFRGKVKKILRRFFPQSS